MDAAAFDRLGRTIWRVGSRRAALGTLLTTAGAILGLAGIDRATAQGECQGNGERCDDGDERCSGRCKREHRGKHVCRRADNQGTCMIDQNACAIQGSPTCGTGSFGSCHCFVTTAGRSFCGETGTIQSGNCGCNSNQECEQSLGKGAKCVQSTDACDDSCPLGTTTSCMGPCETLDPVP